MGNPSPILDVVYLVNVGLGKLALADNLYLSRGDVLSDLARSVSSALGEIPESINDRNEGSGVFKMSQEKEYWKDRYSTGGNSGWCSVGKLRKWRWDIIKKHVSLKNKSVLDVGCGDLRFWVNKGHEDYTGLDISSVIIERNKILYPNWKFICSDVSILDLDKRFDIVFCFEMLFHIMTEAAYIRILQNLNQWTKETLFISCWSKRPDPFVHPHYQAHYQLEEYLQFLPDVRLNKHYSTRKGLRAMYVFERQQR